MKKAKLLTNYKEKIVLATSSNTRIKMLKEYISEFSIQPHKIDESKFKTESKPKKSVFELAKNKALSIQNMYPDHLIIGSDQILFCDNKILSKPHTLEKAKQNLFFMRNKKHTLFSSIYVNLNGKVFYSKTTSAMLYFNNISDKTINDYVKNNKKTVLTTVGSYRIEENQKYNFIKIIRGNKETIKGFPIKDLLKKLKVYG